MENITIGIISKDKVVDGEIYSVVSKNHLKYLQNKCNYISILNYDNSYIDLSILDKCDGIIYQGGLDIYPYHFQILNYLIQNNIPTLGICMGHQIIGLHSIHSTDEKDLIKVDNHNGKDITHNINIEKNSFLNRALGDKIEVNSRHSFALKEVKEPFKVTALSDDNIIEAIEYIDDNHFVLGVQFHPEDMTNTENLYNCFLKEIIKRKK